ncbi:MAG TPA: HD domain-containing protein [Candidatus Acidoferrum sp.]|nr:HD domain-containing protein [Candidatus Acidoferrum sp.]
MIIDDVVHGKIEIREKVLVDLIKSKAFQRLKHITQIGVPQNYVMASESDFSRYDHCIGVMLVLRKLGADLEEQVAGLLHDVSHTAFSHLVDYIFGGGNKENYQDTIHHLFFSDKTELARILKRHDFDPKRISKPELYSLLEMEQPDVCADRFDSTVRSFATAGYSAFAKQSLASIEAKDGTMVFKNMTSARNFAMKHLNWQNPFGGYGGIRFDLRIRWYLFGEALRIAIKEGIVDRNDFLKTDPYILRKITLARDPKIVSILAILSAKKRIAYKIASKKPKVVLLSKFRYVDPLFVEGNKLLRLSKVDKRFGRIISVYRKASAIGIRLESIGGIDIPINNIDS